MYVNFEDLEPRQEVRYRNRVAAVEAYYRSYADIGQAVPIFDIMRQQRNLPDIADPYHFIHYQVQKLEKYFTLLNVKERPRSKKVPDEAVQRAADILAAGYEQRLYTHIGGEMYWWDEARHFTSFKQACMLSAPLRDMVEEYDVTPRHMLRRIHEVAPQLAFSGLPMKIELSPENMLARQEYADWMYERYLTEPFYLYKILWGDETRIYIGRDIHGKLKVYHYPGCYDGQPPITNPLLNKENTIRLDVSLFVDAIRGCSHVEVLTGTTNLALEGRLTPQMQVLCVDRARHGPAHYTVGGWKITQPATPMLLQLMLPRRLHNSST
jgi:hypothetical protein